MPSPTRFQPPKKKGSKEEPNNAKPQAKTPSKNQKNDKQKEEKSQGIENITAQKAHSTFPSDLLEEIPYFKEFIEIDPKNNKRYICKLCKKRNNAENSGYYDNLLNHLTTIAHETSTPDKKELEKALADFRTFRSRNKLKPKKVINSVDVTKARLLIATWIMKNHVPFSLTEELMRFILDIISQFSS